MDTNTIQLLGWFGFKDETKELHYISDKNKRIECRNVDNWILFIFIACLRIINEETFTKKKKYIHLMLTKFDSIAFHAFHHR